jgi:glycosyltransferase involved in cell wall biosynthesis
MRLVFLNNLLYLWGGAEKVLLDQIGLFRAKGHQVFPFSQAHPLNRPEEQRAWFPPLNEYDRKSLAANIPRFFRFIYSRANRVAFRRFLEETKPDLIHAHNIYGGLTTAVLDGAKDAGIPVVLTLHDYKMISPSGILMSGNNPCRNCLERPGTFQCILNRCSRGSLAISFGAYWETWFNRKFHKYESVAAFVAPSRFMADTVAGMGVDRTRIHVVPNSLDPAQYSPGKEKGKYFFYAGRMYPEKGVETLLKCFSAQGAELVLAGEGRELASYRAQAAKYPNIRFLGKLGPEEIRRHYRDCIAVIVPSLWPENASMVVLEALACGKPVVASRIGGLPEQVQDGVNGLLFNPGDSEALGGIVSRLWSDRDLAERLGKNARRNFEERYSQDRYYDELMKVYGRVADGMARSKKG